MDSDSAQQETDEIDVIGGACYDLSERTISAVDSTEGTKGQQKNRIWTAEEQNLFLIGLEQCGNKWSQISKLIGTRTGAQIKSHAKHFFKSSINKDNAAGELTPAIQILRTTEDDVVDIDEPLHNYGVTKDNGTDDVVDIDEPVHNYGVTKDNGTDEAAEEPRKKDELLMIVQLPEDAPLVESRVAQQNLQNDVENRLPVISLETITEEEKLEHPEFFQGGSKKTPNRYIAIRNHILGNWEKKRPNYLTKMAARRGLAHCGDVNSVGKIHAYLEKLGAINGNTVHRKRGRPCKGQNNIRETFISEKMQLRERKAPTVIEDFTNSGRTIEHDEDGNVVRETFITAAPKVVQRPVNPFKLVPCCPYSTDDPQPFEVSVDLSSVLVMDAHAHCLKTEVMGLLGGQIYPGRVCVQLAIPCESLSTGIECEMDPVSQAMAGERIHSQGQQVVGWYHSHPTFAPTPSRRDLETQSAFGDHFWPFVGAIISPFGNASTTASELCFWLMDGKLPRQLNVHHGDVQGILDEELLRELSQSVQLHPDRIALHDNYFQQSTYLEKMLSSVRHHIVSAGASAQAADKIVFQVRTVFDDS